MEKRFSCDCNGCKKACTVKPGWMLPGESEKIADHLGIPLKELFDRFLLVDYYMNYKEGHRYLLSPALKGGVPGTMTPSDPRGTCIFYDEKTEHCQIHPVAPYECRMYDHDRDNSVIQERHKWTAEQWYNEKDQKQLKDLLENEPFIPEMDDETFNKLLIHSIFNI
jgi:Fe-S-cluster containining protein